MGEVKLTLSIEGKEGWHAVDDADEMRDERM